MQIKYIAMKKSILLFILVSLFTCSFAVKPVVTVNEAKQTAVNFLTEQCYINAASIQLTLQHVETDENGEPLFYRFQLNDRGFIIVSATEFYYPVMAFSYESDYSDDTDANVFCASYKKNIQEAKQVQTPVNVNVTKAWNHFNTKNFSKSKSLSANECQPLLTTHWGQTMYYNQYCPFNGNADKDLTPNRKPRDSRTAVGSAGVAMASILNYYRYPAKGKGGVSYISYNEGLYNETYPRIFLDLNEVRYNYDAMTSSLNNYNGEVAKLLYHTGATALTKYSSERSTDRTKTDPAEVDDALRNYWGFPTEAQMIVRPTDIQNDSVWIADYVVPELDARRPVLYSAYKDEDKKKNFCLVIDGYKYMEIPGSGTGASKDVFLHVNLNPSSEAGEMTKGYYMYPSQKFSYVYNPSVIRNLQPVVDSIEKPISTEKVLTAKAGTVSDGAGNMKYASNSHREWLIAAPNATGYTFTFKRLETEKDIDFVSIYKGEEAIEANKIGSYSGQYLSVSATDQTQGTSQQVTFDLPTLPNPIPVENTDKVLVVFTSNDTIEDFGFVLEYSSTYDQSGVSTCASSQVLTNYHYILIDKEQPVIKDSLLVDPETHEVIYNSNDLINQIESEDSPYAANTICNWTVKTQRAESYYIDFRKFDLKAGDFIEITTIEDVPQLLYLFDVFNWPVEGGYAVDANKMKIRFVTDHWSEGDGFELEYWTVLPTVINQESGLSDIKVYPNPASNFLNVELTSDFQNINMNVIDMSGKVLYRDIISHNGGTQIYKVPVSNLASGIYFLQMNTPTGKVIRKFIVR